MGCNNDKVRSFLTKPKARLRAKYDKIQQSEIERDNIYNGVTMFNAKIISLPRAIGSTIVTNSDTNDVLYVASVSVMITDGPSNSIPDPQFAADAFDAIEIISMHETALVEQNLLSQIKLGDLVVVQYEKPYNNDTTQVPVIVSKIRTDLEYGNKIKNIFDNDGGIQKFFNQIPSSTLDALALASAKVRDYYHVGGSSEQVVNGDVQFFLLDFLQKEDGSNIVSSGDKVMHDGKTVIEYYSNDAAGGLAFIKGHEINFAENLKQLAIAYKTAWKKPLYITSCYRSFAKQQQLYKNPGPGWAAYPGTSDHGWGLAFDWSPGTGKAKFTDPEYNWMATNAYTHGFYNAGKNFKNQEPWHFEVLNSYRDSFYGPTGSQ